MTYKNSFTFHVDAPVTVVGPALVKAEAGRSQRQGARAELQRGLYDKLGPRQLEEVQPGTRYRAELETPDGWALIYDYSLAEEAEGGTTVNVSLLQKKKVLNPVRWASYPAGLTLNSLLSSALKKAIAEEVTSLC